MGGQPRIYDTLQTTSKTEKNGKILAFAGYTSMHQGITMVDAMPENLTADRSVPDLVNKVPARTKLSIARFKKITFGQV